MNVSQNSKVRGAALGSGGAASILFLCYELFVSKSEFVEYKWEATHKASVQWQRIMDLDNALDAARMEIVRLQTVKTNKP